MRKMRSFLALLLVAVLLAAALPFASAATPDCMDEDELATCGSYFTHMRQDEAGLAEKTTGILLNLLDGVRVSQNDVRVPAIFKMGKTT